MDESMAIKRARNTRRVANGVIIVAMVLPLIAVNFGLMSAQKAGTMVGKSLFAVLLFLALLALSIKKWPEHKKAAARLIVAVLWLLGTAGSVIVAIKENAVQYRSSEATFKAHLLLSAPMGGTGAFPGETPGEAGYRVARTENLTRQLARLAEIDKEIDTIDLRAMVTPAALTAADAIQASRLTCVRYLLLIADREAYARRSVRENESLVKKADVSTTLRIKLQERLRQASVPTLAAIDRLNQERRASVQALRAALDFSESRLGTIKVVDNALLATQDADTATLEGLLEAVQASIRRQSGIQDEIDELSVRGRLRYG